MTAMPAYRFLWNALLVLLLSAMFAPAHASTRAIVIAGLGGNVEFNASFA